MSKLPPSSTTIRFVADELARSRGGERDKVTLDDVRNLVAGTAELIAPHFQRWMAGEMPEAPPSEGEARMMDVISDLERRLVGAIRDGGASRSPAREAAAPAASTPSGGRKATDEQLRAVVRAALSESAPASTGSFLTDIWDAAKDAPVRRVRTRRPDGVKKRRPPRTMRKPDVPKEVRRQRAAWRLAKVRAVAFQGLAPSGGPTGRPPRRISKSDWIGARNVFFARHAAAALRNAGYPLIPHELCALVAARGGPRMRAPSRDVMQQLSGSPMIRVGVRCRIWFEGETPPQRPRWTSRRDTSDALARELAKRLFDKVLDCVKAAGSDGISLERIRQKFGPELADFNRDWLAQRMKRAAADPKTLMTKIPGGFQWAAGTRRAGVRKR